MTKTIATPIEQKRPHEMLQTPWIILYIVKRECEGCDVVNLNSKKKYKSI